MEFRTSTRLFESNSPHREWFQIPYVSLSGKLSIHTLYVWKTYPQSVFYSVVSTVYQRLLKILLKRFNYKLSRRYRDIIIKISILYILNQNDTLIDRFLGMARSRTPIKYVAGYAHYCVSDLDENKRFVYSQAYFQANWLKFQASRPSDKSRDSYHRGSHLRNLFSNEFVDLNAKMREHDIFRNYVNFWRWDAPSNFDNDEWALSSVGTRSEYSNDLSESLSELTDSE
jgi:hypothetical protein